ncbi:MULTISPECIES: hypothetical protein [unclassified Shewanella]|uniref:hypothetical protein n=1 Tax=unclassified Shewanella TaxID=196818 RepID=UPI0039B4AA2D
MMESMKPDLDVAFDFLNKCAFDASSQYNSVRYNTENPNLYLVARYVASVVNHDWLQNLISTLLPDQPEVTEHNFDELIARLVSIDDILSTVETLNMEIADQFYEISSTLPLAHPESDTNKVQQFASADSLGKAFESSNFIDDLRPILSHLRSDEAELLHAALACQMSGLDKVAKIIMKEFTRKLFTYGNMFFVLLMMELAYSKETKRNATIASKAGNDSKHQLSRKLRAEAITLYQNGKFHSARHAARQLLPQVAAISEKLGSQLEWHTNGFARLYKWLLAADKNK